VLGRCWYPGRGVDCEKAACSSAWRLTKQCASGRLTYGIEERFEGRDPLPKLDIDTAGNPLSPGEEREGYVSFAFPHTTSAAVQEAVLTLSVHDEQGKRSTTTIDIPALEALGEHTVKNWR
jgi:hypothetical protein